jgi:hypothetical protein
MHFGALHPHRVKTSLIPMALLLSLVWGCEQGPPAAEGESIEESASREPFEGGDPLILVAEVLETPRPPPCGASTFRVPVRYRVIRVEAGTLSDAEILVRQDCPEAARPRGDAGPIVVGAVHRLTLDPEPHRTRRHVQWIPRQTDRAEGD